jgi:hypothetical protein
MPMRAYRASTAYASAHVTANTWLWIGIFSAATALTGLLLYYAGRGSRWGDVMAFCGMVLGILVMMKSQEGYVAPEMSDDEDDVLPAASTAPQNPL